LESCEIVTLNSMSFGRDVIDTLNEFDCRKLRGIEPRGD
jgi:hypothetical protein